MSLSKYTEYKDSLVGWLGDIPSHWKCKPCRGMQADRNERNEPLINENYLSLMANIGIILYEEKGDVGNKKPEDLGKCKQVYPGDLVINSMNYGIGSYGLSKHRGVCSPFYIVLTPKLNEVEERYAFRILEIKKFQQYAQSFGNGILEHRASISWDILKNIGLPLPPIKEQQAILQFLDSETEKIDALVKYQRKLIELLKEKRQAFISHTVTKGLDPKVKMKDSGVELLDQVPEHWEVKKIKYVVNVMASNVDKKTYDGDIPCLLCNYTDVYYNEQIKKDMEFMSATATPEQITKFTLKKDDVIITKDSESPDDIAIAAYVPEDLIGVVCGYHLSIIRAFEIHGMFVKRLFDSHYLKSKFATLANGLTRYGLGQHSINNVYIPIPPEEEQRRIVDCINRTCKEIDDLINKSKIEINLLTERRSALISESVTGQIDVRNYQIKEAA